MEAQGKGQHREAQQRHLKSDLPQTGRMLRLVQHMFAVYETADCIVGEAMPPV